MLRGLQINLGTKMRRTFVLTFMISMTTLCAPINSWADNFRQQWSGWGIASPGADANGDMQGGIVGGFTGKGRLSKGKLGSATNQLSLDTVVGGSCDTAAGPDTGLQLIYIRHTNVMRTVKGDLLYRKMSSSPTSTACLDFSTQSVSATVYLDIVGGTGKFADATGSTILTTTIQLLPGINGITGLEKGTINLR